MTSFESSEDERTTPVRLLSDTRATGAPGFGWLRTTAVTISLAPAAYVIVTTLMMMITGWSPVPFWDHWDLLIFSPERIFSRWLFAQDNEHREVALKLILAIDTFLFAGTGKFALFCNVAFPAALAGVLVRLAHRHISRDWVDTLWMAGLVATLLFSAMQFENLLLPLQPAYLEIGLTAAGCFACLALGRHGLPTLTLAIGLEAIAVYSAANGMLVPLLAIPLALWAGRSKTEVAVLGLAFIILLGSYLNGYVTPFGHSDPLQTIFQPGVIAYVAVQLGAPIALPLFDMGHPGWLAAGLALGGFGLVLLGSMTIILLRRYRDTRNVQLVLLALAVFGVGTAVLIALGRLRFGLVHALSSRYTSVVLLFWVSLTLLLITEIWRRRPNLRLAAVVLSLPLLMAIALQQTNFVYRGAAYVALRREAAPALLANVYDEAVFRKIYPDPSRVAQLAPKLRAQHLALFAEPWSDWLGTPLADHVQLTEGVRCRGAVEAVSALPGSARGEARLTGWASDATDQALDRIVIADNAGTVVGYGIGGFTANKDAPPNTGWHGYFAATADDTLTVYAMLDERRAACFFGRLLREAEHSTHPVN
jgi:hypothetical protein